MIYLSWWGGRLWEWEGEGEALCGGGWMGGAFLGVGGIGVYRWHMWAQVKA